MTQKTQQTALSTESTPAPRQDRSAAALRDLGDANLALWEERGEAKYYQRALAAYWRGHREGADPRCGAGYAFLLEVGAEAAPGPAREAQFRRAERVRGAVRRTCLEALRAGVRDAQGVVKPRRLRLMSALAEANAGLGQREAARVLARLVTADDTRTGERLGERLDRIDALHGHPIALQLSLLGSGAARPAAQA